MELLPKCSNISMLMYIVRKHMDIQISDGLDLEQYPCPWILLWAGHSEPDGFGSGSGFAISIQTRSITILIQSCHQTLGPSLAPTPLPSGQHPPPT
jgi:hypothetical protein